ncbi:MAG: carbonic anhydrase [Actinomycetota bacterium]
MATPRPDPGRTWSGLLEANRVSAQPPNGYPTHRPDAVVVCCSDARVPPSFVFDRPAGSLFVVRAAGHALGPEGIASIDYAVTALAVPLVVVLGHTDCGVAHAAVGGNEPWYLAPLVEPLGVLTETHPEAGVDDIVRANVVRTMEVLGAHGGPTGTAIRARTVAVRGGVYDLRTGLVTPVEADLAVWTDA